MSVLNIIQLLCKLDILIVSMVLVRYYTAFIGKNDKILNTVRRVSAFIWGEQSYICLCCFQVFTVHTTI